MLEAIASDIQCTVLTTFSAERPAVELRFVDAGHVRRPGPQRKRQIEIAYQRFAGVDHGEQVDIEQVRSRDPVVRQPGPRRSGSWRAANPRALIDRA